jgi:hypothetical protein
MFKWAVPMGGLGMISHQSIVKALAVAFAAVASFCCTSSHASDVCKSQKDDIAGCQPGAFAPPLAAMPSTRVNAAGVIDHRASDDDTRQGAKLLEGKLGLFRNFDHVHWIPLDTSQVDPVTGNESGGDMDGQGDGRGLTIAGKCLFGGHWNTPPVYRTLPPGSPEAQIAGKAAVAEGKANGTLPAHGIDILRIQDNPIENPPKIVGEIPAPVRGYEDTMISASIITKADGHDQIVLMRDMDEAVGKGDGRMYVYALDPATCKVVSSSEPYLFGGDFHEPGAWIDPKNARRMLIVASSYISGDPDPNNPGGQTPDIRVMAITDEKTGHILPKPVNLAAFRLQDVGGPVTNERPDATGLFSDGRFADWSNVKEAGGLPVSTSKIQENGVHQSTMSSDGERIYVAGSTAGFYILNSAAIAQHSNESIVANKASCNRASTNIYVDGVIGGAIDATALERVTADCLHMVINDDPGVKAIVKSGKIGAYLALQDRSRWDPFPPRPVHTGIHSAIAVPDRPSLDKYNAGRPSLVFLSEERFDCPYGSVFILQIDSEGTPQVLGTFGLPVNVMENCVTLPVLEPNGERRHPSVYLSHDPTVFKNLAFVTWMGQGLRAIDISNPRNMREVGYAVTIPSGLARSYPVYKDGLFYWMDMSTGIQVARYNGPRADELPRDGLVYEGNSVPHR